MTFKFPSFKFPFFSRDINGSTFYDYKEFGEWGILGGSNLKIAQNHPILTPGLLFVSKLFSQAEIYIEDTRTGKRVDDHWFLKLLTNPNYYQTKNDFLETHQFTQIAAGKAVVWLKRTTGMATPTAMYLLNPEKILYPDEFKTGLSGAAENNPVRKIKIKYDEHGENLEIPIKDLLFFYDLANGLDTENFFEVSSRLDGLKQTLINTNDSLLAKNIILKTNGKELITGDQKAGSFPLSNDEKKSAEDLIQNKYGLGFNRKRGIVTQASLSWQSLHIALRDLGLDESVKVDGNLIYTALHIPKDILSLEAKKTTYNNFKESMVSYIQNEMQPTLESALATFQKIIPEPHFKLRGSYEKMPIMQFILIERYDGIAKRGLALSSLRNAGLPDDVALDLCGFDKSVKLRELMTEQDGKETGEKDKEDDKE